MVKKERLEFIPGFPRVRVNNKYDSRYHPRPGGDIIREAEKMVDEVLPYPVTPKTCERFVAALRYNMPFTDQFPEPHRGDLLEFPRDRFTHWGLYMGDGYVIHLAPIGAAEGRSRARARLQSPEQGSDPPTPPGRRYHAGGRGEDRYGRGVLLPLPQLRALRHGAEIRPRFLRAGQCSPLY
nr:PREDICTED: HRAS-like suppressor 3 isoform X3 [Lepisosteus oculatus]